MTRVAVAGITTAIAFGAAATALAAGQQYNGPAGSAPGAGVEFGTRVTGGHPVTVRRFEFHNIPAPCAGSAPTAVSDLLATKTFKVSATRRFGGSATLNGGKVAVTVSGRLSASYAKAVGTLRVKGSVPGCGKADTGVVKWTAPRVGRG